MNTKKHFSERLSELTLEEKVGQLFLVALDGPTLTNEYKKHFQRHKLGNFIFFKHNLTDYKSIRQLSDSLQSTVKESVGIPAFISVDQEGGMVTRVYSGATHFPSNMAVAASGMFDSIDRMGEMVATELRALGINLNHAPSVDVNNNADNPVIGIRSYSDDPQAVAKMGMSYIQGLQRGGVMANAKHFPGHGDTNMDSHLDLPAVNHEMERLNSIELVPFKAVISNANGVDSIMTAHIIFKAIDNALPATLSHKILTEFLRKELGFEGLVITDCMTMNAIKTYYTTEKGCIMALKAGADILCLNATPEIQANCYNAVLEAVKSEEIPIDEIDAKVQRILDHKKKYSLCCTPDQPIEKYPEHEALSDEISAKSITLVKGNDTLLPLTGKKVFIISPRPSGTIVDDVIEQESFCKKAATEFGGDCKFTEISIDPDENEINAVLSKAEGFDIVLYATYNAVLNPGQVHLFDALKAAGKQIVTVSLRVPYDIWKLEGADCYIAAYEYTDRAVDNAIKAIVGKLDFVGKLPISNPVNK
ncbi:MAG: beta-N-acetylhexosaminidase [Defluviitaleaceae bacterium]|nr:beta-N-acetylhexosaminidase [Defluviitaleaceae bacterium]